MQSVMVTKGVYWVAIPEAGLSILCGCPADSAKLLMRKGLIVGTSWNGVAFETGPNAILLSDTSTQNEAFANLSEFPFLQMLYRQGMMVPGHPGNTGQKPLLIGLESQVLSQSTRRVLDNRRFLQGTWLFGELIGFSVERAISAAMERISVSAGTIVDHGPGAFLFLLEKGEIDLLHDGRPCEKLGSGAFWGEEVALGGPRLFRGRAVVFALPAPLIADVPIVQWRLLQTAEKRSHTAAKK